MYHQGMLSRVPTIVLFGFAVVACALALTGALVSLALREPGALVMAAIPMLWLCMVRLELRDRARR